MLIYVIPVGLPGSGKTYFLNQLLHNEKNIFLHLFDDKKSINKIKERKRLPNNCSEKLFINKYNKILFDVLVTTTDDIVNFIKLLNLNNQKINLELHYWKENKEYCLYNDMFKREETSINTIQTRKLEKPDLNLIKDEFKDLIIDIKLIEHEIVKKPESKLFLDKINLLLRYNGNKDYFYSDSWDISGIRCGYNGCTDPIEPDNEKEFESFDKIINIIYPDIKFLEYKLLNKHCNEIEEFDETDWYGGCIYKRRHECDINKLYDWFKENKPGELESFLNKIEKQYD